MIWVRVAFLVSQEKHSHGALALFGKEEVEKISRFIPNIAPVRLRGRLILIKNDLAEACVVGAPLVSVSGNRDKRQKRLPLPASFCEDRVAFGFEVFHVCAHDFAPFRVYQLALCLFALVLGAPHPVRAVAVPEKPPPRPPEERARLAFAPEGYNKIDDRAAGNQRAGVIVPVSHNGSSPPRETADEAVPRK